MIFPIYSVHATEQKRKKRTLTCVTCKLKQCVGRCRWEPAECPRPPKGKIA